MFASGICAVHCAVIVYDQRAVAVVNFQAAIRTTAHAIVRTSWHGKNAVFRRCVVDPPCDSASAALLRRVGFLCGGRLLLLLLRRTGTCGGAPRAAVSR